MLVYKNGVYYIDSLKETVDARGDENADDTDEIYISIRKIIGMRLRTIFLFRYIITRPTIGKQSDNLGGAGAAWRSGDLFYKRTCAPADS